ncbi:Ankyrin repeat-containing domain [Phytophthora cactorum]|nr:Ankyrin repeat-containing domain [Phytophthora cactorum]
MDTSGSLLTSIRVVCRSHPRIYTLDHVLQKLDEFLFPSQKLTLPRCVQHCSARLFTRVLISLDNDKTRCKFEKLQQYRLAMLAAAELGQLWMVQQLYRRHPAALNGATALAAGQSGHLPLIQWVNETKCHLMTMNFYAAVYKAFKTSASRGDLPTVQWFVNNFSNVVFDISIPAEEGQLEVTKWVLEQGRYRCRFDVADDVAERGDLEMMQFLVNHALVEGPSSAPDLAAEFGHLELWLYESCDEQCSPAAMAGAAKNCHVEVIKWLFNFCALKCPTYVMMNAVATGNFEMLEFLKNSMQLDCCSVTTAGIVAVMDPQEEVIQWLTENYPEG